MSSIDDLLTRARVEHRPCGQEEIDAAAARIAGRVPLSDEGMVLSSAEPRAAFGRSASDAGNISAGRDLTVLCEAVIGHAAALADLDGFFARVPDPTGARVLGCMLELSGREDSARFLWQYAAGAGDPAAYCLALHHRALGESGEADWWQAQTGAVLAPTAGDTEFEEIEPTTALRILRAPKTGTPTVPEPVTAVLHYVPAAVRFIDDDLDLPLPDPDFTDRIHALTTAATQPTSSNARSSAPLPSRNACTARPRIPATT
ncbi:hypothetical protein [Streptomyces sp. NBC_00690]|uniref:hypothetical protein n=1 Tax=Streptomyces sp. NBC_00690 TaxID=2975808 RepID=UPI002E288604|nr:hypothetical protein [Streptomyces sp. NBC_00690]